MAEGLASKVRVLGQEADVGFVALLGSVVIAGAYFYRDTIRQALDNAWSTVFPKKEEPLHPLAIRDLTSTWVLAPGDVLIGLSISGTVVDQQTGSPAAGAFVWVREKGTTNEMGLATTALDGKFTGTVNTLGATKPEVAGIARELQARKTGFANSTWFDAPTAALVNGHLKVDGIVDGYAGDLLTYTVKSSTGEPARGARIHLLRDGKEVKSTICDANGRASLSCSSPGDYHLVASTRNILSQKMLVHLGRSSRPPVLHGYSAPARQVI